MGDGQAKPTNINYSLYGQWYAGKTGSQEKKQTLVCNIQRCQLCK